MGIVQACVGGNRRDGDVVPMHGWRVGGSNIFLTMLLIVMILVQVGEDVGPDQSSYHIEAEHE